MKTNLRLLLVVPGVLTVLLLALAGCGGALSGAGSGPDPASIDSGDSSSSGGVATGSTAAETPAQHSVKPATSRGVLTGGGSATVGPLSRSVISTGEITVRAADIDRARTEAMRLVGVWGGIVADEKTTSDRRGRAQESTLTLRVPSPRFSEALTALGRLGKVEQQSRSSEDVTTQVIDNDARVRAADRSIRTVEDLLARATKLGEVISIESDLARRQADLDSLKSQQKWLADQTSLSTVTVTLTRDAPRLAPKTDAHGFLAGLARGWHALGGATVALLTLIGAVLPFVVLLVLLGVPVWLLRRRRTPVAVPEA